MEKLILEIGLAITLFLGTNVDDIFVLLTFFSDKRFKTREVIVGQYLGIFVLTIGSMILSFGVAQVSTFYIGFLGIIPLMLGIKKLYELVHKSPEQDKNIENIKAQNSTRIMVVASITIANGGDNIGVYVPFFANKPLSILVVYLSMFLILTGVWCAFAFYLVRHKHIGSKIKQVSHFLIPWIFIGLGIYICVKNWFL